MVVENMTPSSNTKPWMSDEYDISVPENEELWSQRVIDEYAKESLDKIAAAEDNNGNEKTKK